MWPKENLRGHVDEKPDQETLSVQDASQQRTVFPISWPDPI